MKALQNENNKLLVFTLYFIAVLLGLETGGFQYSVLKVAVEFNLNSTQMGSIVSVYFVATMIAPLIMGSISDVIGKKKVIIAAMVIFLAGCMISMASEELSILYIGIFVVGFAFASLDSLSTAAMSDISQEKSGKHISIMQAIFSLGCFLAPLILNYLMKGNHFGWRILFCICFGLALISLVFVILAKFKDVIRMPDSDNMVQAEKKVKPEAYLILMILCIAIYVFMENGITYFTDIFMSQDMNAPEKSAFALSLFWAAMVISRFVSGLLYRYENWIIKLSFLFTLVLLVGLSLIDSASAALGVYFVLGLTCAPIWPLITGKLNRAYKAHTGFVTGLVLIATGVGGAISPYIMGKINDISGMAVVFMSIAAACIIGLLAYNRAESKGMRMRINR